MLMRIILGQFRLAGEGGKLVRLGLLAVNMQNQAFYNLEKPDFGPEWQLRVQMQFLFPKM